jgi:PAS domain S-box-containing protein
MNTFHKLLERQVRKYCNGKPLPPEVMQLLNAVNESYHYHDRDQTLLERAMDLSSRELLETNERLQEELKNKTIAERTIFEKDQIIRSINENLREAVFRASQDKIIYINQAFVELFGYDSEKDALNASPEDFYFNKESYQRILLKLLKSKSIKSEEILLRRKDGSVFWGMVSSMITEDKDGNDYFDGAIVDITTQKRNEENLKNANAQLQKVNSELDRFVYSASHDLRAPLKSLLGLLNLIELEKGQDISLYLDRMRQSVVKLDHFITDIIDYSLNTRVEVTAEPINLNELIDDCFLHFKYLPYSESINKIVAFKSDVPFYGDKKRLQIIFNNLISNAINYRNPTQQQSFIKIDVDTKSDISMINIHDNGVGIDEKHIDKIFNMFYRGTTDSTGSGLGLYIVKEALEKMRGKIQVSSKRNIGTTFTLQVPNHYKDYAHF